MLEIILSFIASCGLTFLIIRYKHLHLAYSSDGNLYSPQKVHKYPTPRIGGISIAVAISVSYAIFILRSKSLDIYAALLICSIPAFAIGFAEDLSKKISVLMRLLFTSLSALGLIFFLNTYINHLDIPIVDILFSTPIIGIVFTIFAITGLANAYNIIDGFNGLAGAVGTISLLSIAYVSFAAGDFMLITPCLIMIAAILGFLIWNYPLGLIFLGDGGAYLIGFWVGSLSVLLCARNPEVSPWFALVVNAYPVMETLFTIYRRYFKKGGNPGMPDRIHLHTLIYRRLLHSKRYKNVVICNSRTSPYLWLLSMLSVFPAIIWWNSTPILLFLAVIFYAAYLTLYQSIVRFRTPKWI